jgi:hypothetical protein
MRVCCLQGALRGAQPGDATVGATCEAGEKTREVSDWVNQCSEREAQVLLPTPVASGRLSEPPP